MVTRALGVDQELADVSNARLLAARHFRLPAVPFARPRLARAHERAVAHAIQIGVAVRAIENPAGIQMCPLVRPRCTKLWVLKEARGWARRVTLGNPAYRLIAQKEKKNTQGKKISQTASER